MTMDVSRPPAARSSGDAKRLVAGFIAGFIAVLVFHQLMLGLLHLLGVTPATPYALRATAPLGVPAVLSSAFWGGVWGVVFALVDRHFPAGRAYWLAALVFGALGPSLVAWFVVQPLKGLPPGNGFPPAGVLTGLLVNGAWGIGTALILNLYDRRR